MPFNYARPDADSADGGWSNQAGSQTNLYASIDETIADDADYISSSPGNNNDIVKLSLSDVSSVSNPTIVRYRYKKNAGGDLAPVNMQATLLQGSTVIAQWQHNDIGTSYTLAEQSLTSGQFSAISDLTNLFLQFQTFWWLADASIDLWFVNAQYYDSSDPTVGITDFLSCSRASIGYAKNADGTVTQFANDTLRITDLGLLVEDARTNMKQYSQTYTGIRWSVFGASVITDNAAVAPDGTTTAGKIAETTTTNSFAISGDSSDAFITGTQIGTLSVFLKQGTQRYAWIGLFGSDSTPDRIGVIAVDLQTGTITDTSGSSNTVDFATTVETYGNGWYRFSITQTLEQFVLGVYVGCLNTGTPTYSTGFPNGYAGNAANYVYVWGAQFEIGGFPSSYIPTTSAAATRAADNILTVGNLTTLLTASTCSCIVDYKKTGSLGVFEAIISDDTTNNAVLDSRQTNEVTNDARAVSVLGGVEVDSGNSGQNWFNGLKGGTSWSGVGISVTIAGNFLGTDAFISNEVAAPAVGHKNLTNFVFGYFRRITVWNSKLADATLQALTAP